MRNRPFFLRRRAPAGRRSGPLAGGLANPMLNGLVSHWRLSDEADAHGSNYLTNNGTATFSTGKIGNALYTNGTDQYLSVADNASLSMGSGVSFTISAWLYLTSNLLFAKAIQKGDEGLTSTTDYAIGYAPAATDRIRFTIGDSTNGQILAADTFGAPPLDTWFFVVAWYDFSTGPAADTMNIQIDGGTADSVASTPNGSRDSTRQLDIGRGFGSIASVFWPGRIDSVSIWKRVLTAAERTALYNGGAGLDYPFLAS